MYSVLLVDDEPLALKGNRIIIERSGLEIEKLHEAENGLEAWEFLQKNHVDLVVTDIKMPNMDGVTLCRKIFEAGMDCKTIIVSGYADFEYARQAMKYGVGDYILKPAQREELIQSVASVLYRTGQRRKEGKGHIPYKKLEHILALLQEGIWLDIQEDTESGFCLYKEAMDEVREDCCLAVAEDFCRLLAEKLSLKLGQTILSEHGLQSGMGKEAILSQTNEYITEIKRELLKRKYTDYTEVLLDMAGKYLEENYAEDITLADLAARTGFSTNYFSQIFKEKTGKTFVQCRTEYRIQKAMELLKWSGKSITDIAMEVGYSDSTYFIRVFKEMTGRTPSSYKKRREQGEENHPGI